MNRNPKNLPGLPTDLYRPLQDQDVDRIADAAFEILMKAGLKVYSEEALQAFAQAGAVVNPQDRIVKLPRRLVEDAIDSNPCSITLYGRDHAPDAVLEDSKVHYGTGGTAIYVLDPDTGQRRESLVRDVILNAQLVEVLDNIHVFTINVFPNDITHRDAIDVNRFYHSLNNTSKHVMGGVYSMAGCQKVVCMAQTIAGGEEALRQRPFVSFITLIISPFKIDQAYGDMTCYLAREGLPVVVPTEPICGTTSPVTLAGNVLTHIAETLAGVALVQCVNRGAPAICGSVGSIPDLRSMAHVGGAIERGMINAAVAQMAQRFQLPFYSTAGTTDAKEVDVQASYESAMSNLLVAMSGANYIHDAAGLMESDLTVSYEKLIIDNEILGMCQRVIRGIEVNDQTLALDLILEKGPGQDYLAEPHTVEHMRDEFFMPSLADRDKRAPDTAGQTVLSRAKAFLHAHLSRSHVCRLDDDVRQRILNHYPEISTEIESVSWT